MTLDIYFNLEDVNCNLFKENLKNKLLEIVGKFGFFEKVARNKINYSF